MPPSMPMSSATNVACESACPVSARVVSGHVVSARASARARSCQVRRALAVCGFGSVMVLCAGVSVVGVRMVGGTHAPAALPYGAPVYPLLQPVMRGVQFVSYSHIISPYISPACSPRDLLYLPNTSRPACRAGR